MGEQMKNALSNELLQKRKNPRSDDFRGPYYRDTTAILHSSAFRRMKHKTQVFFAPSNDHICTRMEHALHVSSIASSICKGLGLDDELAWAIGLGHDLGHTPFGHIGEIILSRMMQEQGLGLFEHEVHSLRVVDFLSQHGEGMNLTYAVRDGIVSHCGESFQQSITPSHQLKDLTQIKEKQGLIPSTWEGVVVRFSDSIAYLGRDWEDACRLNVIQKKDLPSDVRAILGDSNSTIIDRLVRDLVKTSKEEKGICLSDTMFQAIQKMKDYNYTHIYRSPMLQGYEKYYTRLLHLIADYLHYLHRTFKKDLTGYESEKNMLAYGFGRYVVDMEEAYLLHDGNTKRLVYDYIAGMSDNFAQDCAYEILVPKHLNDSIEYSLGGKWFNKNDD